MSARGTACVSLLGLAMASACGTHPAQGQPIDASGGDAAMDDTSTPAGDAELGDADPPGEAGADGGEGGQAQQALWYKFLGDGAYEVVGGVAVDGSGNVLYTGYFQGTVDFGGGPLTATGMSSDIFLAKYDPTGNYLWAARYGDSQVQEASGIAVDAEGNVVITGNNEGVLDFGNGTPLTTAGLADIFVAKFDPTGKALWAKDYGDPTTQSGQSVAVDAQGNIGLTGNMQGTTNFGPGVLTSAGMDDLFVAKLDPSGNTLWSQRYGDATEQFGWFVAFDPSGDVVVTADFQGTIDVGKGPLVSAGAYDVLLAKLDPNGNAIFGKRWGDSLNQLGDCVAVDPAGEIVLSGGFQGSIDLGMGAATAADMGAKYLAKFDPNGNTLWSKTFGDGDPFDWTALALDPKGGVTIVGEFVTSIDFGEGPIQAKGSYDIFAARFDTGGQVVWGDRYGAEDSQYAQSVALNTAGDVVMGGYFLGKLGFSSGTGMSATGNGLLYLVELSP
jgi:hypothetical protein